MKAGYRRGIFPPENSNPKVSPLQIRANPELTLYRMDFRKCGRSILRFPNREYRNMLTFSLRFFDFFCLKMVFTLQFGKFSKFILLPWNQQPSEFIFILKAVVAFLMAIHSTNFIKCLQIVVWCHCVHSHCTVGSVATSKNQEPKMPERYTEPSQVSLL